MRMSFGTFILECVRASSLSILQNLSFFNRMIRRLIQSPPLQKLIPSIQSNPIACIHASSSILARHRRSPTPKPMMDYKDGIIDRVLDELFLDAPKSKKSKPAQTPISKETDESDQIKSNDALKSSEASGLIEDVEPLETPSKKKAAEPEFFETETERIERKSIMQEYYERDSTLSSADKEAEDWYMNTAHNLPKEVSDFTPRWMKGIERARERESGIVTRDQMESSDTLTLEYIVALLKEEHAQNLTVIDMTTKCDYTDYLVIAEGQSKRQIYSLVESVRAAVSSLDSHQKAKKKIKTDPLLPEYLSIEGVESDDWMVLDLGRFIVHAFSPEARRQYDLDGLWTLVRDPMLGLDPKETADAVIRNWETRPVPKEHIKSTTAEDIPSEDSTLGARYA